MVDWKAEIGDIITIAVIIVVILVIVYVVVAYIDDKLILADVHGYNFVYCIHEPTNTTITYPEGTDC